MNLDRFKNFGSDVRDLVLSFEQQPQSRPFFDVEQLEIIADYYLEVADVEGLESAVRYGEQLFPSNGEILLRRAHLLSVTGEYAKSLELLKQLENADPENTDISYALGATYSMTEQPRKAIQYYLRAATDGYELGMIYGNIADEYYKLGDDDRAVEYYRKSIEVTPDEERSLYNLAKIWDDNALNDQSLAFFTHHVEEHPYAKGAWYSLGCIYYWTRQYEKSVDAFEYALAIDKTLFNAYLGLSDAHLAMQHYPQAVQALRDSLDYADDRPMIIYSMGRIYMDQGNYHAAISFIHDAIKEDPSYSLAWNDLGRCCEAIGLAEEAAGYYRRAIDLEPDADEHWITLADLYIRTQRFAEAASLLENGRTGALEVFLFDSRLIYCCFMLGRRNRMLQILRADADQYGDYFPSLLQQYPALASDLDVMNIINGE